MSKEQLEELRGLLNDIKEAAKLEYSAERLAGNITKAEYSHGELFVALSVLQWLDGKGL
jgi:hypothetical protein